MPPVTRSVRLGLAAAVLAGAAWLLWPAALGGSTTYVTTHGISMEPRFSTGDLAILRTSGSYAVGDVVAYRSADLDTVVMHRLVAETGGRFTVKGDNNSFLDPDHPTRAQILGKLWLRVPQGGRWMSALHSPRGIALVALVVPLLLWPRRRRGRHSGGAASRASRTARSSRISRAARIAVPLPARALARQVAAGCGVVALVAVVGEGVLLLVPATVSSSDAVLVTQQGSYSYSGTAAPGTTYPSGTVRTGDPLYTQLVHDLTVTFRDQLTGPGLTGLTGTMHLALSVTAGDGWSAPLPVGAEAPVRGGEVTASVGVDPVAASAVLQRHLAEIGSGGGTASLVVTPTLAVSGTVAGHRFGVTRAPALSFGLTPVSLAVAGSGASALAPAASVSVPVHRVSPRRLPLLSVSVPIPTARLVVGGLLVAALAGWVVAGLLGRRGPGGPAEEVRLRTAHRILPVARFTPGDVVVEVADGAALHRVAERLDALVLHASGPDGDVFAVRDGDTTYRLLVPADLPPRLTAVPAQRSA